MALYIPHSIFHLARLSYARPETFGPYYVYYYYYYYYHHQHNGMSSIQISRKIILLVTNKQWILCSLGFHILKNRYNFSQCPHRQMIIFEDV